jgi:biotin carboxyl carrier protein
VPDAGPRRERTAKIESATRQADHAGIERLAEELLPALIAKLGTTHLGELEVREGDWHVRLRRPFGTVPGEGRRAGDRSGRAQPGHDGHGHGRAASEGARASRPAGGASGITAGSGAASASTNGTGPDEDALDKSRAIATSPAVGIFQPGARAASGTRVRTGDSLGSVNVLGVPQEVLAPVDGVVGSTFVEAGMAVEYGQDLIRIELATLSAGSSGSSGSSGSTGSGGSAGSGGSGAAGLSASASDG